MPRSQPRPPGVASAAHIDVETGQIYVWDDNPPAFNEGFLAEELHHYFQLVELGLLGTRTPLSVDQIKAIETDVIARVTASGFAPYHYRDYAPYTNVPRPPGVAGSDQ